MKITPDIWWELEALGRGVFGEHILRDERELMAA
jgi:hypothetical protein